MAFRKRNVYLLITQCIFCITWAIGMYSLVALKTTAADENFHDDVVKWTHISLNQPFVWAIKTSPLYSQHKRQWCRNLKISLLLALVSIWANSEPYSCLLGALYIRFWFHSYVHSNIYFRRDFSADPHGMTKHPTMFSWKVFHPSPTKPFGNIQPDSKPLSIIVEFRTIPSAGLALASRKLAAGVYCCMIWLKKWKYLTRLMFGIFVKLVGLRVLILGWQSQSW